MKILILDDDEIIVRKPADFYIDPHDFTQDTIVQVASTEAFMALFLVDKVWDEIWFDNDLGASPMGMDLARDLSGLYDQFNGKVLTDIGKFRVTTMNVVAQKSITTDLLKTGIPVEVTPISFMRDHGICRGNPIPRDKRNEPIKVCN